MSSWQVCVQLKGQASSPDCSCFPLWAPAVLENFCALVIMQTKELPVLAQVLLANVSQCLSQARLGPGHLMPSECSHTSTLSLLLACSLSFHLLTLSPVGSYLPVPRGVTGLFSLP